MPGNVELVERINQDDQLKNLPIGWALRFDAITNTKFQQYFSKDKNLGLLLEITPLLASESGVAYKGKSSGEDWYLARNAFLIGYRLDERKKLIDNAFSIFKRTFGYFPQFSVSWMIDAWSLSYINKVYGVSLHEITKEQFETDSYTLYGGIFNAPYYPSAGHPLIPGKENDMLPVVMVRQTISDLSYNYGTQKAFYTSQPNDYLSEDLGEFEYFKKLVSTTLNQSSAHKFAVIGFENSYTEQKFQDEYIKQLIHLRKLSDEGKIRIIAPEDYASKHTNKFKYNQAFSLSSSIDREAVDVYWYFSAFYRARILKRGNKLILTDLRNYLSLKDHYADKPTDVDYAYWIVPYLIDGSQMFTKPSNHVISNDIKGNSFGIVLGEGNFESEVADESLSFIDQASGNRIQFTPKFVSIDASFNLSFNSTIEKDLSTIMKGNQVVSIDFVRHPKFVAKYLDGELKLGWNVEGNDIFLFNVREENDRYLLYPQDKIKAIDLLVPIFAPDKSTLPFDLSHSIFYWHNQNAIAGRNPIRLFILPRNKYQRPVNVQKVQANITPENSVEITFPSDYSYRLTPWFIDMTADDAIEAKLSLKVNNQDVIKDTPISFYTDCKIEPKSCLKHPGQFIGYVRSIAEESLRAILFKLQAA